MTNFSFPDVATWRHHSSREGFEAVFFAERHVAGHVAGIEAGEPYGVRYEIWLDERWHTRTARVWGRSRRGPDTVELEADGEGHWVVDGEVRDELDGVFDVDLEASSLTNAFPVRRLALEQRYECIGERRYDTGHPRSTPAASSSTTSSGSCSTTRTSPFAS